MDGYRAIQYLKLNIGDPVFANEPKLQGDNFLIFNFWQIWHTLTHDVYEQFQNSFKEWKK